MIDHQMLDTEPTLHNTKDKYEILDWAKIPNECPCEMNYRLPSHRGSEQMASAVWTILFTALVCATVRLVLAMGPAEFITQRSSFGMAMLIAVFAALSVVWNTRFGDVSAAINAALAVLSISGILYLISRGSGVWMLATFVVLAPTVIGVLADRIATHQAFWMTANPRVTSTVMRAWRADWQRRFEGMSHRPPSRELSVTERRRFFQSLTLRGYYPIGFFVLTACFLLAAFVAVVMAKKLGSPKIAILLLLNTTVIFIAAACAQAIALPKSAPAFVEALGSFFSYGKDITSPPWVFQSPCGDWTARYVSLIAAPAVISIMVSSLAVSQGIPLATPKSSGELLVRIGLFTVVLPSVVTVLNVLLGCYLAVAPTLVGYGESLDSAGAPEQQPAWSEFDGYVHRLQSSINPIERRSNLIGFHPIWEFPILADTDLYFEHQHVLGATGTGKTALSVTTDVIQLIRRNDGPVIVLDCKGDRALMETCRLEAEAAQRKFKWFTNKTNRSTYIFNPLAHLSSPEFTLAEVLGVLLQSFNLHHGDEYARAYFGKAMRILLRAAYLATVSQAGNRRGFDPYGTGFRAEKIESLWDLDDILRDLAANNREYEAARHLSMLVASLCDFDQLNLTASRAPHEPAVRHAISMPEVIQEKQVIYFHLVGSMDSASVGEIGRLALFSANSAAIQHRDRTGERPRVHIIADEAQCLLAKNVETVLQQSRDSGLGFLLSHQSLSQLNLPGGVDLTAQIMNSTCIKRYHSARDAAMQKYISEISGTTKYYLRSWKQFKRRVMDGTVSSRYACSDADGVMRVDISEAVGPRLEPEDIRDINRDINKCVVFVDRSSGYSQFLGGFPMVTEWPTASGRDRTPWPSNDEETITITGAWPAPTEETVMATQAPPNVNPEELDAALRGLLTSEAE